MLMQWVVALAVGAPFLESLDQLAKDTGNPPIVDLRRDKSNPDVQPASDNGFWPRLDGLVRQAKCGYSLYQENGKLALVDTPLAKTPVQYEGFCRLAIKRIGVSHDFDTATRLCHVAVEVAWEPKFLPFYLDVGAMTARLGKVHPIAHAGQIRVAGRLAQEIDLRFPGPDRSETVLAQLSGSVKLLGSHKLLAFDFDPMPGVKWSALTQDEVTVRTRQADGTFPVEIKNPPGGPAFESFQSWLDYNRLLLTDGKRTIEGKSLQDDNRGSLSASIVYEAELPRPLAGWKLRVLTPARIVEVPVSVRFVDVPLP